MPLKILLGILIIFITCKGNETKKIYPKAVKGVLDLRALRYDCRDSTECVGTSSPSGNHSATESSHVGESWDFATDGTINLDGEWEFYWKEFYTSEDFLDPTKRSEIEKKREWMKVPLSIPER